ncbi:MAG: signal peptidase II [Clostridia bacterium]|nr:signal peptidase II [Clostridia bacterium]
MLLFFLLMAGVILADQLTKILALQYLAPVGSYPLWENVLHLTYVENTGAAFGMLKDHRWVFLVISTVALGGMIVYMFLNKSRHPLETVAVAFIVGGGIGNMIDRIARGFVVDFVDVKCIPFWKYIFNVADIFVCVGCGLFILYVLLYEARAKKAEDAA